MKEFEQLIDLFTIAKLSDKTYVLETDVIELIGKQCYDVLCDRTVLIRKFILSERSIRSLRNVTTFGTAFSATISGKTNAEIVQLLYREAEDFIK